MATKQMRKVSNPTTRRRRASYSPSRSKATVVHVARHASPGVIFRSGSTTLVEWAPTTRAIRPASAQPTTAPLDIEWAKGDVAAVRGHTFVFKHELIAPINHAVKLLGELFSIRGEPQLELDSEYGQVYIRFDAVGTPETLFDTFSEFQLKMLEGEFSDAMQYIGVDYRIVGSDEA